MASMASMAPMNRADIQAQRVSIDFLWQLSSHNRVGSERAWDTSLPA